jgi:hypothetical protein
MLHRLGSAICSCTVDTAITWRRGTWCGLQFHDSRHRGRYHYVGECANSILLLRSDTGCDLGHLETGGRTAPRTAYRLLLDLHQATIRPFRNGTAISACIQRRFQRKLEAVGVKHNITSALRTVWTNQHFILIISLHILLPCQTYSAPGTPLEHMQLLFRLTFPIT